MKSIWAIFGTLLALTLLDLALAKRGRGQCPSTEGMMGTCVESCATDADCQGNNKCCSNGCGHACMPPVEGGRERNGCKYTKGDWTACDEATNTMSRSGTLRRGGQECEATKTTTKPCREGRSDHCKYKKGPWGDCDVTSSTKSRTLTLKKGDPAACEATKTEEKSCNGGNSDKAKRRKNGNRRNKEKSFRCHYTLTNSTQCDDVTNTRTMTLTLRKGLPSICEQSKTVSKPCRERTANGCTYGEPQVSGCVDNQKTITKTLVSGDPSLCEETKSKTKRCGGGGGGGRNRGAKKAKKNRRRKQDQQDTA